MRGDVYAKTEKHDTAIENFMQALRLVARSNKQLRPGEGSHHKAIILSRTANVKLAQGKHDDAIRFSIRSMKLIEGYTIGEDFAEPWYILGMAWLKQGREDRALYCFTSATAKHTRDSHYENSLLERARILQKTWRFKEAFDACTRILQRSPNHVEALVERACSRFGEAFRWSSEDIEDLSKAVRTSPDYPQAWFMLADYLS